MKKNLVISLLLVIAMTAAACGNSSSKETTAAATTEAAESEQEEEEENTGSLLGGSNAHSITLQADIVLADTEIEAGLLGDTQDISKDEKFSAAEINISQADFESLGFALGDSCDVVFSNGYTLTDVPYYNGYYVNYGAPVIVAYPGAEHILITLNNQGIWDQAGLAEGDTIDISLNETGKYAAIQETLGQQYSFVRDDYDSDEEFCNFRALSGGNLKENFFFRGASPVDNSRGRAAYTDGLLEANGIKFIIDLADSEANIDTYMASSDFNSPYAAELYANGDIALLNMGSAYQSEAYQQKVVLGMQEMLEAEGPVYIHCMEGKDRTGFVCMLVEALAGASYDEMLSDYMMTYQNYYSVSEEETPEKYDAIASLYFDAFVSYLHDTEDIEELKAADYTEDAKAYLKAGGMTDEEIEQLVAYISE